MAYAALISLKETIKRLCQSSRVKLVSPPKEIENLEKGVDVLISQRKTSRLYDSSDAYLLSREAVADLDRRTIEAVHKFEDALESHVSNQLLLQCESAGDESFGDESYPFNFTLDLQEVDQEIDFFTTWSSKIKTEALELTESLIKDNDGVSSRILGRTEEERSKMSYAALISLMATIERILKSSEISIEPPCPKLELVYKDLASLQVLLEFERGLNLSQKVVPDLDTQIKEATCKLKDALQSHITNHLHSKVGRPGDESYPSEFSIDLQEVEQEIDFFTTMVSKIKEGYSTKGSKVIGLHDEINKLKDRVVVDNDDLLVIPIVGMVGIGKTTLAREVYEDPLILNHFERRAWVTIGPINQSEKIMSDLLDQLSPGIDEMSGTFVHGKSNHLYECLRLKRYLIVLDDIWDTDIWDEFESLFPDDGQGSRIMLTTRIEDVAFYACKSLERIHRMQFLTYKESWYMFCEKVFAGNLCPSELEMAAKKIVQNCEGLPLAIIIVGNHLSKSEKTPEYWTKVAEKKIPVFDRADRLEVIFLSYRYLPQHLKACFLYMGVFPQDSEINASKLIKLWCAEGLFEPNPRYTLEDIATECLEDLVSKNLVMVRRRNSNGRTKICGVHYVFQHLCISEASKYKFFHVINNYANGLTEAIKDHRRLCIHNNVLFGIKDVYKSMTQASATVRSLLCTGLYHQYQVPMCPGLSLIRVLDALTIHFYTFPFEILNFVQLRYLAFTYDGKLPTSISKFWGLQYLIIRQHLNIKSSRGPQYLPIEIWKMKELRHLQVMGSELPDPCGGSLPKLLTLLDVGAHSCTWQVLRGVPNLKKLGIHIQIPLDIVEPLGWLNGVSLSYLYRLETLKCVIVNPHPMSRIAGHCPWLPCLPYNLKKLSLSGFGYDQWKYIGVSVARTNIEVLKLRGHACGGPTWEAYNWNLSQIRYLLIEDSDMEYMVGELPKLERLIIRHCYKLKDIPLYFPKLEMMELVDCNPSFAEPAKETMTLVSRKLQVSVHFSGDDE